MTLRVHRIAESTTMEGPGKRYCVWVQGCGRHCGGCLAADTWDANGGELFTTDEITQNALGAAGIEGITFVGGEPFEQARPLYEIGKALKARGLSVVTYTGYTLEEIQASNNDDFNCLIEVTDLLIDGAFQIDKKSFDRPWVGSSNQRYIFLSDRYNEDDISRVANKLEVRIFPDGKTQVTGIGDFTLMREYIN